jgi:hypothetical protein
VTGCGPTAAPPAVRRWSTLLPCCMRRAGLRVVLVVPTSQHTNLLPLVEGPGIRLASRHAKIRRGGYRTRAR